MATYLIGRMIRQGKINIDGQVVAIILAIMLDIVIGFYIGLFLFGG
jgi:hypothetical protein